MRGRSRAGSTKSRRRKAAAPKRGSGTKAARPRRSAAATQESNIARLTRERDEALEQQGAAAEVLKIVSASRTELEPALDVIVRSAARYCKADDVTLFELDGPDLRATAHWGAVPHLEGLRFPCTRGSVAGRVILERMPVHVIDLQAEAEDFPEGSAMARRFGHRTIASVPLLREGVAVGTLQLRRTEVNPFTDKQIALLGTFAAQAVIAIENARLLNELRQSLEQQTASANVLRIISSSPGELQPVFEAMLQNAVRICDARFGSLALLEGDGFRFVALHGAPPKYRDARQREPLIRAGSRANLTRVLKTKQVVQIADIAAEEPNISVAKDAGARTLINVPMLKDDDLVGIIAIYRQEVRPFTDKQIELVKNFAAQAVIAIENARLLNELRQRTADLSESLEQQTATSEVLKVISSSRGELEPVFQAMLEKAVSICDAKFGTLFRFDGNAFQMAARVNTPAALAEFQKQRGPFLPPSGSNLDRMMKTKQVQHSADEPVPAQGAKLGGARSIVHVPMLQGERLVGALVIYRQEVRPFTEKQIELLKNFAAQAVIAIENARLLNELRESLEQQTATADVLRVISSSPGELDAVFGTILEKATRICEANFGILNLYQNGGLYMGAMHNVPSAFAEWHQSHPGAYQPIPGSPPDRVIRTKKVSHVLDNAAEPAPGRAATLGGARSTVCVPMLKDEELIGTITIFRQEVRAFTDEQIALLANFANQAVIAIENARLLNELRQSLERQTAMSEVLSVISRSPGDLDPVFETILGNAVRICEAKFGGLFLSEGSGFRSVAQQGPLLDWWQKDPLLDVRRHPGLPLSRVAATKAIVHVADLAAEAVAHVGDLRFAALVETAGARTVLGVPMLKDDDLIGAIIIYRSEIRSFTDKQIALLQNFAAQAVIAIENARLLNELRERTEEVVKLNQQLEQRVADQVGEIERMGRLRRFLPPQVADLIVASGTEKQLESHRREITALFCDLRGFTGFSESSDPEDVMALLAEYHAAIGTIINKYSGTLERYAGDGVMVIFNDPVPVENPALQAVLMAIEMRTAIGGMIEKWRDIGHDLGFGIGIAHGFATLGTIGFEGRRDYAAIGTVSNVASRLCDEAKPGQILISPRVRQAVEKMVTVESIGEFALKGIRRPMLAYNVIEAAPTKLN